MRKILLPPVLTLLCLLGMLASRYSEITNFWHTGGWNIIGYIFLGIGLMLPIWGSQTFKRYKTNILPYKDPGTMVTDGPFRFTRNPMYLGMLLGLIGAATLVGTTQAFLFPPLFFIVANWWYIPFEEDRMGSIFGEAFEVYKAQVRRWL